MMRSSGTLGGGWLGGWVGGWQGCSNTHCTCVCAACMTANGFEFVHVYMMFGQMMGPEDSSVQSLLR